MAVMGIVEHMCVYRVYNFLLLCFLTGPIYSEMKKYREITNENCVK